MVTSGLHLKTHDKIEDLLVIQLNPSEASLEPTEHVQWNDLGTGMQVSTHFVLSFKHWFTTINKQF